MTEALIGFEARKLDPDERAPWQMIVDSYQDGKIIRYTVQGMFYERRERTEADMRRGGFDADKAAQLTALDLQFGERLATLTRDLQREQIRVLHGEAGVELIDRDAPTMPVPGEVQVGPLVFEYQRPGIGVAKGTIDGDAELIGYCEVVTPDEWAAFTRAVAR